MKLKTLRTILLIAFSSSLLVLALTGCSSTDGYRDNFVYSTAFEQMKPTEDYCNPSTYQVTEFDGQIKQSDRNDIVGEMCEFTATVENDYFSIEVTGTGFESSDDVYEYFIEGDCPITAKKAPDTFSKDQHSGRHLPYVEWLEGKELTLGQSEDKLTATYDGELTHDEWFGTIGVGEPVVLECSNTTSPGHNAGWSTDDELSEMFLVSPSEQLSGTYNSESTDIVPSFTVSNENGELNLSFGINPYEYTEMRTGTLIIGEVDKWTFEGAEVSSPVSGKVMEFEGQYTLYLECDLDETYPVPESEGKNDARLCGKCTVAFQDSQPNEAKFDKIPLYGIYNQALFGNHAPNTTFSMNDDTHDAALNVNDYVALGDGVYKKA